MAVGFDTEMWDVFSMCHWVVVGLDGCFPTKSFKGRGGGWKSLEVVHVAQSTCLRCPHLQDGPWAP